MKKALFSEAEIAEAVQEFEVYMAPRTVVAGGKNGDVKVYGENPNARKPPPINTYAEEEEISGLLQELGN